MMTFYRHDFSRFHLLGAVALFGLLAATPAYSQFQGENIRGDSGVNSGSMGPPGVYLILPYDQQYARRIKDADGNLVLPQVFKGFDVGLPMPTVYAVTSKKILGGNYGFSVSVPFSGFRPERTSEQSSSSTSWGVSDLYVSPITLGWTTSHADFLTGYAFNAPTGRYEVGGDDNAGMGMWSHEIQGGTTVYLDAAKKYSVATVALLEMHSKKKDQDLRVGNILTLEGGAGYNIEKIGAAFGVGYVVQQKVSNDSGADVPVTALRLTNLYGKNRILGIGPDVTTGLFQKGRTVGQLNVRYFWEMAARSTFEGSTFFLSFTIGRLAKETATATK